MTLATCACLNVKVHGGGPPAEVAPPPAGLKAFSRPTTLGMGGVQLEFPVLALTRLADNGWSVLHCGHCDHDVVAVHAPATAGALPLSDLAAHRGTFWVHDSCLKEAELEAVRTSTSYSPLYRVVATSSTANAAGPPDSDVPPTSELAAVQRQLDDALRGAAAQLEREMQERVRRYVQEQQRLLDEQRMRMQADRQSLWQSALAVHKSRTVLGRRRASTLLGSSADASEAPTRSLPIPPVTSTASASAVSASASPSTSAMAAASTASTFARTANVDSVDADAMAAALAGIALAPASPPKDDSASAIFQLDGFEESTAAPKFIVDFADEPIGGPRAVGTGGDPDADDVGAPLKAPPPSMASSLFGSSVPMNIPRQFTGAGRTLLSQSLLAQAAAQLGGEAASLRVGATVPPVPEHDNLVAPSADDLDPADPSGQFMAPHEFAARTYVDDSAVLFGERPSRRQRTAEEEAL